MVEFCWITPFIAESYKWSTDDHRKCSTAAFLGCHDFRLSNTSLYTTVFHWAVVIDYLSLRPPSIVCECVCVSVYYVFVLMCLQLCMSRGQWEWWVCKRVTASSLYIAPPSAPRLALGAVLKFQPNSSGQISTKGRLYLTAIGYLRTALNHFQRST